MSGLLKDIQEKLGKSYSDLEVLLDCFKEVLIDNNEKELANAIPWINENYVASENMSLKEIQVFSIAFQLLNMAEIHGAVQNRRQVEGNHEFEKINGLWANNLKALEKLGYTQQEIAEALKNIQVEPVLTAHPTEAKRQTVLEHHKELYRLIVRSDIANLTDSERDENIREVKLVLDKLWRTGEIYRQKPDVLSELQNVLYFLTNVFPETVNRVDRRLAIAWKEMGYDESLIEDWHNFPKISFGDWVGGDRDGHPLVTAEVTESTLNQMRLNAFIVIRRKLLELNQSLTIDKSIDDMDENFTIHFNAMIDNCGNKGSKEIAIYEGEVYRQYISLMLLKLPLDVKRSHATELKETEYSYITDYELVSDLEVLQESLLKIGAKSIAYSEVHDVLRIVSSIGFHLAHVDIRQNSDFHDLAVSQLLNAAGMDGEAFMIYNSKEKFDFLDSELKSNRPFTHSDSELEKNAKTVIDCLTVVTNHVNKYDTKAIGSFIVSMTRSVNDLLVVYLLAREAGLTFMDKDGLVCKIPVVPLLETIEDLENGPEIMEAFLQHPITRRSLSYQKDLKKTSAQVQQIMVGYSDSNKDGGIMASQWGLYKAQSKLSKICRDQGVDSRFFHGKGGSISRGSGPTHWFIKGLPPHSVNGNMRLTEQGETINQKYSNQFQAVYNMEILLAGTTAKYLSDKRTVEKEYEYADIIQKLATWSEEFYSAMIHEEHFLKFFTEATPIDVLEHSKIGSRPARRTGTRSLDDLRAIPWVFSWSQSRFNITSWFGIGSTLEKLITEAPEDFTKLQEAIKVDSFVRYVFTNVDTALASTDEEIMKMYASMVTDEEAKEAMLNVYLTELKKTKEMLSKLIMRPSAERRKNHTYSTALRSEAMLSLHQRQVQLIKKWRSQKAEDSKEQEETLLTILMTINAIASAMRSTG
jgi:phosphoenolpyruvate carboxylase